MSDMDMSDMISLFLEEAEEQLQKLDEGILDLEKDPDNLEIIKEIFRAAHTLKGSSATMGFKELADLTHAMENLLDCLRNSKLKATAEIVDLLLESIDSLRTLIEQLSRGEPFSLDSTELVKNLHEAVETGGENVSANKTEEKTINESSENNIKRQSSASMTLRLKISPDCQMPSVRAFMIYNAIAGLGDVVSSDVADDKLDDVQAGQEINIEFVPANSPDDVINACKSLSEIELIHYEMPSEDLNDQCENNQEDEELQKTEKTKLENEKKNTSDSSKSQESESSTKAIQTVRVGVDRLDTLMNLIAELVIDRTRISKIESDLSLKYENEDLVQSLGETAIHIGRVVTELQEHIMKVRLLPVGQVFNRFPRMVRDLSRKADKEIEFILIGEETELDRSILEDIVDPITHLLRNAVDHGIETPEEREAIGKPRIATVTLAAKQEENRIFIEVEDDGRGIDVEKIRAAAVKKGIVGAEAVARMNDDEALQLLFASGVSTKEEITEISGRGVGMDVVRNNIQGLSGSVDVKTELGKGTKFRISLPLTLAIIQALVTDVCGRIIVIPLSAVVETFRCDKRDVHSVDGHPAINFRGQVLPLVKLGFLYENIVQKIDDEWITFVVVNTGSMKVGLIVDKLIGEQEVVIKPLGSFFGDISGIAGATILGDGKVALIVDVAGLQGLINKRKSEKDSLEFVEA